MRRRRFNTTGSCSSKKHYMVNLDERLKKIEEDYIEEGCYFVINRGRQYGKTTTLKMLAEYLKNTYAVISVDFQGIGTAEYKSENAFARAFAEIFVKAFQNVDVADRERLIEPVAVFAKKPGEVTLRELFNWISELCAGSQKPVVMMIDEVDSASNDQVFIDFLALLRQYYLNQDDQPTFHSVILAGVYNIKNLKLKLRPESEHQYNSPWNIAADFKIDMSFSICQIMDMLEGYEKDHHTGMDIQAVAEEVYAYTSGYPVLVSSICKHIDEDILDGENSRNKKAAWSKKGVEEAVKMILVDSSPLFGSMVRHLDDFPQMKRMFQSILFEGQEFSYNPDTKEIGLACMFGYTSVRDGKVQIANRIFETRLYNYFLSEEELTSVIGSVAKRDKGYFIHDGRLDMDEALKKFVEYFSDIYGENDDQFIESSGRKLFLMYLRPIINGVGNYYIEAQTRDTRRTDIIVDYAGEQFIVELKIWHGNEYNKRGERQLLDYLEYYHKDKGYMLSFNFNKNKKTGIHELKFGNKTIVEAVV